MPKFCYLGDTLGSGGDVVEAARARVRCAWAKFKELSPGLTVRGASYRIKGRIYSACVQSVLIYGTETWAVKAENLRSLERTEHMMVRWMCGVSLRDRKCNEDLCNLLGINHVVDVVRRGRLRWFGHLERKSVDGWVSSCRRLVVSGVGTTGSVGSADSPLLGVRGRVGSGLPYVFQITGSVDPKAYWQKVLH